MNNKTLFAVILILTCITLTTLSAADEVDVSGRNENYTFDAEVNNKNTSGMCLDAEKSGPGAGEGGQATYNISEYGNGSSSAEAKVTDDAKKLLLKYYRYSNNYTENRALQVAMWSAINGESISDNGAHLLNGSTQEELDLAQQMFNYLSTSDSNLDLDKLLYKSNGTIYAFELFTGITNQLSAGGNELQDVLLFLYNTLNPEVGTSAVEKDTGSKNPVVSQNTTIVDTVKYTDLVINQTYTVVGVLMDKLTGEVLKINGQNVTATKTFVANSSNGFIDLEFNFDASELAGRAVVVFEKLYLGLDLIASHEDINDTNQTVVFKNSTIGTSAVENESNSSNPAPKKPITIKDTVTYNNLAIGKEYTVKGILMDKSTGNPLLINGEQVTAIKTFIASAVNGTIDLEFTFDASELAGRAIVVFEKLFLNDVEVAAHEDINDVGQTIEFRNDTPEIKTSAKEKNTGLKNNIVGKAKTIIVDTISYINLIVGKQYTISGVLMDKETGKPLLVNGKEIRAERTFIPTTPNGTIDLEFIFDGRGLAGKTIVVFEKLFSNGTEVTSHEDITDEEQTVSIKPEPPEAQPPEEEPPEAQPPITKASMKSTGIPILLILLTVLATLGIYKKKK